ncbi:MAG: hypothetical protein NXI21_01920 [Alphaproteobacteria bacterium]|nr:hypothetical protein [Alphaproteobacteria bacterium]
MISDRQCRLCGCTDITACVEPDGSPCGWADEDLCTACSARFFESGVLFQAAECWAELVGEHGLGDATAPELALKTIQPLFGLGGGVGGPFGGPEINLLVMRTALLQVAARALAAIEQVDAAIDEMGGRSF